jgi:hypothetical protein
MHLIALATNDTNAGAWMTLVIPVGFLAIVLVWAWTMRRRVP